MVKGRLTNVRTYSGARLVFCQGLEAVVTMMIAPTRGDNPVGQAQAIAFPLTFSQQDPAGQDGETLLNINSCKTVPIEPEFFTTISAELLG